MVLRRLHPPPPRYGWPAGSAARCAATAARCAPATASSPGLARVRRPRVRRRGAGRWRGGLSGRGRRRRAFAFEDHRIAVLTGLKSAVGAVADAVFDHPSRRLQVIAVTGTNGKTSTAWWTAQALTALGPRCAVVGTLASATPDGHYGSRPRRHRADDADPVTLHAALRASSTPATTPARSRRRRSASPRTGSTARASTSRCSPTSRATTSTTTATWTPTGRQARLFAWPGLRAAVINIDDALGAALADRSCTAAPLELWTYRRRRGGAACAPRGSAIATAAWPSTCARAARGGDGRDAAWSATTTSPTCWR